MNPKTRFLLGVFAGLLAIVLVAALWPKKSAGPDFSLPGWGDVSKKLDKSEEEGPIDRIELQVGKDKLVLARVDKSNWSMSPPEGARADRYKVRQIVDLFKEPLSSVLSSRVEDRDRAVFGFDDENRIHVTLYQAGTRKADVEIGKVQKPEEGYGDGDSFLRVPGEDRAWRINAKDLRRPFEGGVKALRDKRVFAFEAADVIGVRIADPGAADPADREIELVSEEGKVAAEDPASQETKKPDRAWRFAKPEGFLAGDVKGFVASVASTYAQEFVDTLPPGVKAGKDGYTIHLALAGGRTAVLSVSESREEAAYLAVEGSPGFVKVSKYTGDSLRKRMVDLRDKTLFGVRKTDIRAIEIVDGDKRVSLAGERGTWQAVEPASMPVGKAQVDALLADLESLKADKLLGATELEGKVTGLDKPQATVALTLKDGGRRTLKIGAEEPKGTFYAALSGGPEVYTLGQWQVGKVRKSPSDLRNKRLFDFDAERIVSVELVHKDETVALVRTPGAEGKEAAWKATKPREAADLKPDATRSLANTLAGLTIKDFTPDRKVEAVASDVALEVTVVLTDGSRHSLKVSNAKKDQDPYAASTTEPDFKGAVFTLNPYQVKNFTKRLAELAK
jgi:hypothetical protein